MECFSPSCGSGMYRKMEDVNQQCLCGEGKRASFSLSVGSSAAWAYSDQMHTTWDTEPNKQGCETLSPDKGTNKGLSKPM